ncbi:hypothetical protein K239x_22680 [Planctomycetes bacterium K23_9]|uniref:Uncharacterized protein n=1 Tax=Stieleria marina TaxID=1930275 RepID=A0A517NT66_9BACT|nr:hypothetical protein K239x_22680 [Planctomycetes bacterium K23_9]
MICGRSEQTKQIANSGPKTSPTSYPINRVSLTPDNIRKYGNSLRQGLSDEFPGFTT